MGLGFIYGTGVSLNLTKKWLEQLWSTWMSLFSLHMHMKSIYLNNKHEKRKDGQAFIWIYQLEGCEPGSNLSVLSFMTGEDQVQKIC